MERIQRLKDIKYQKKECTFRNFRKLMQTNTPNFSEDFTVSNCDWKLAVYREKEGNKDLAIYLHVADASNLPKGWSIYADFTITVVNQSSREKSKPPKCRKYTFCEKKVRCGSSSFMPLEVLEGEKGFIHDNKCIVEVGFYVVTPGLDDIKTLVGIKEQFVTPLKKVFSWYPLLLDFRQNRNLQSKVSAFNDLGRVLKFLDDKKWQDMMDETYRKELRDLFRKLGKSGLDLRWLEPTITSALNMEGYVTKLEEVTKLETKLKALDIEEKKLKEELRGTQQHVEMTRKDLKKAEGFKKKDLNAKIGCPKIET